MNRWAFLFAISLSLAGLFPAPAAAEDEALASLNPATVKKIFRLVTGQPELKDGEIGVSPGLDGVWTCIWTRAGDHEVVVLQVRDSDGAYRTPVMTDLSSLKFGMRLDLKEQIRAIVESARKPAPDRRPNG